MIWRPAERPRRLMPTVMIRTSNHTSTLTHNVCCWCCAWSPVSKRSNSCAAICCRAPYSSYAASPQNPCTSLKSCLDIALLPDGFTVSLNRDSLYSDQKMALLLPNTRGRDITDHHLGEMLEVLDRSLKTTIPLWICWPKDQDLRDPLHADFCHQIELAAIDADIVLALLHHTHATQTELDENAIRAVLPSDEMLNTLSNSQILMALRAPTAEQVAQRLSKMLGTRKRAQHQTKPPRAP